jgi:FkbM family methyltransferase
MEKQVIKYPLYRITHPAFNHGETTEIVVATNNHDIDNQIGEIYIEQCYKPPKKKNKIVFDIGANIGLASLYLKDFADKIYAFEPNPYIFPCLVKNTEKYPQIIPINKGIFNRTAELPMYGKENEVPQSFVKNKAHTIQTMAKIIRIDEFMEENKIEHIDFLKIDVEGAEYTIFMDEAFSSIASKVDVICGESHNTDDGLMPILIPEILKDYGFKTRFKEELKPNYTLNFSYARPDTGYYKEYQVFMKTIFEATR